MDNFDHRLSHWGRTRNSDIDGMWLVDKIEGYLVNLAAATTAIESTQVAVRD